MAKTMLIADDLTGALDAGVCLLPADVLVATSPEGVTCELVSSCPAAISVNAGTRHLDAVSAAARVAALVEVAREAGVPCVVKKTDSALRGNVGAELTAAWRASGLPRIHFIPALPEMGRVTRGGVHYVDGVPVAESAFGRDPFEPVRVSDVRALVSSQTDAPVHLVEEGSPAPLDASGIVIYDATSTESMVARVRELRDAGELGVVAGCAGVTDALAGVLDLGRMHGEKSLDGGNLLAVCGSVNSASRAQCRFAEGSGARVMRIGEREKCDDSWLDSEDGRSFVSRAERVVGECPPHRRRWVGARGPHGARARGHGCPPGRRGPHRRDSREHLRVRRLHGRVLVTGGDILASFLAQSGVERVRPLDQPAPGIVGFELDLRGQRLVIFSKSGGFGSRELLVEMAGRSREMAKECAHA